MNFHSEPARTTQDAKLQAYRVRLIARLCILLVCLVQVLLRFISILRNASRGHTVAYIFRGCSFFTVMIIIIIIEYIFYKKKSSKVVKYSNITDFVLLLLFMGDWVIGLVYAFTGAPVPNPPCFRAIVIFGFTQFAWRTMLVTLIVKQWYLKIIPSVAAVSISAGFIVHYSPMGRGDLISITVSQVLSLIIIIYCEDKVKWKIMWINIQQEKWLQVNNFILNNIPENIMILDFQGDVRFISDYCRDFIQHCNFFVKNHRELFKRIHSLHQLQNGDISTMVPTGGPNRIATQQEENVATHHELMAETTTLLKVETLEDLIVNFKRIIEGHVLQEKQFLVYNGKLKLDKEESERSIEIKISFVQHFKNEFIILILRDTTQRDLLVTLEETNKYKDQLLASVSHELRAPLNGNINMVEGAVNSKKIPDSVKESLLIPALRSSKFLLHIINDILDMSQIKEKKLRLTFQPENLQETIKTTAQLVELQAKKKGILLLIEIDERVPKLFCTDHIRLSQIILNLLNNAIKFTKEGVVKLVATSVEGEPDWVQITVEDSGIGMTDDNVKKLFKNYTQIEFEGRQSMNPTGVGLGLNIAYNLAELLAPQGHGKMTVVSTPKQGSTFTFIIENKETETIRLEGDLSPPNINDENPGVITLPKMVRSGTSNVLLMEKSESSVATPMFCLCPKILIVDDNPFNTMAFETILNSLDIKCDSVYNGHCAIKKLLNRETERCNKGDCKPYSLIFLDQEMPEMSGTETAQEIKRLQEEGQISPFVKIVGCTGHQPGEEVDRFMKAGLDKCIHKPITPVLIQEILKEYGVM